MTEMLTYTTFRDTTMLTELIVEQRDRGATLLISSHDAEFLEIVCDVIYKMKLGKIVEKIDVQRRAS